MLLVVVEKEEEEEEGERRRKKRGGKVGGGCGVGCGEGGGGGACRLQNRMQDKDLTLQFWISRGKRPIRGVARGERGGKTASGAELEGASMMPTSSTTLLFYRIILVCFSTKIIVN